MFHSMGWFVGNIGPKKDFIEFRYIDNDSAELDTDDGFSIVGQDSDEI